MRLFSVTLHSSNTCQAHHTLLVYYHTICSGQHRENISTSREEEKKTQQITTCCHGTRPPRFGQIRVYYMLHQGTWSSELEWWFCQISSSVPQRPPLLPCQRAEPSLRYQSLPTRNQASHACQCQHQSINPKTPSSSSIANQLQKWRPIIYSINNLACSSSTYQSKEVKGKQPDTIWL